MATFSGATTGLEGLYRSKTLSRQPRQTSRGGTLSASQQSKLSAMSAGLQGSISGGPALPEVVSQYQQIQLVSKKAQDCIHHSLPTRHMWLDLLIACSWQEPRPCPRVSVRS